MKYPPLKVVETASSLQLQEWYQRLSTPGLDAIDNFNFYEIRKHEEKIWDRIKLRQHSLNNVIECRK